MRSLAFALVAPMAMTFALTGCGEEEEGGAFMTQTDEASSGSEASSTTGVPVDMGDSGSATGDTTATADTGMTDTGMTDTTDSGMTDTTDTGMTDTTDSSSTTSGGMCGNGTIETGEQCDGSNLNGFGCSDLGFSGGTLACDPVTCTFDTSACTTNPGSTGY